MKKFLLLFACLISIVTAYAQVEETLMEFKPQKTNDAELLNVKTANPTEVTLGKTITNKQRKWTATSSKALTPAGNSYSTYSTSSRIVFGGQRDQNKLTLSSDDFAGYTITSVQVYAIGSAGASKFEVSLSVGDTAETDKLSVSGNSSIQNKTWTLNPGREGNITITYDATNGKGGIGVGTIIIKGIKKQEGPTTLTLTALNPDKIVNGEYFSLTDLFSFDPNTDAAKAAVDISFTDEAGNATSNIMEDNGRYKAIENGTYKAVATIKSTETENFKFADDATSVTSSVTVVNPTLTLTPNNYTGDLPSDSNKILLFTFNPDTEAAKKAVEYEVTSDGNHDALYDNTDGLTATDYDTYTVTATLKAGASFVFPEGVTFYSATATLKEPERVAVTTDVTPDENGVYQIKTGDKVTVTSTDGNILLWRENKSGTWTGAGATTYTFAPKYRPAHYNYYVKSTADKADWDGQLIEINVSRYDAPTAALASSAMSFNLAKGETTGKNEITYTGVIEAAPLTATYTSSASAVAEVAADGTVTAKSVGKATITVSFSCAAEEGDNADDYYTALPADLTFDVEVTNNVNSDALIDFADKPLGLTANTDLSGEYDVKEGLTVTFGGSDTQKSKYNTSDKQLRWYAGNNVKFEIPGGSIKSVIFKGTSTSYPVNRISKASDAPGEFATTEPDNNTRTWTAKEGESVESITFINSASAQARVNTITIVYTPPTMTDITVTAGADVVKEEEQTFDVPFTVEPAKALSSLVYTVAGVSEGATAEGLSYDAATGKFTAVKPGKYTITASVSEKAANLYKITETSTTVVNVTVTAIEACEVTVSGAANVTAFLNEPFKNPFKVTPADRADIFDYAVVIPSGQPKNGLKYDAATDEFTGSSKGNYQITATMKEGKDKYFTLAPNSVMSIDVEVIERPVANVRFEPTVQEDTNIPYIQVYAGDDYKVTALEADAKVMFKRNANGEWQTSESNVYTNRLPFRNSRYSYYWKTDKDDASSAGTRVEIKVAARPTPKTRFEYKEVEFNIAADFMVMKNECHVTGTTDKAPIKVTYKSSNPNIVSVGPNGILRAVNVGEAVITAHFECPNQCGSVSEPTEEMYPNTDVDHYYTEIPADRTCTVRVIDKPDMDGTYDFTVENAHGLTSVDSHTGGNSSYIAVGTNMNAGGPIGINLTLNASTEGKTNTFRHWYEGTDENLKYYLRTYKAGQLDFSVGGDEGSKGYITKIVFDCAAPNSLALVDPTVGTYESGVFTAAEGTTPSTVSLKNTGDPFNINKIMIEYVPGKILKAAKLFLPAEIELQHEYAANLYDSDAFKTKDEPYSITLDQSLYNTPYFCTNEIPEGKSFGDLFFATLTPLFEKVSAEDVHVNAPHHAYNEPTVTFTAPDRIEISGDATAGLYALTIGLTEAGKEEYSYALTGLSEISCEMRLMPTFDNIYTHGVRFVNSDGADTYEIVVPEGVGLENVKIEFIDTGYSVAEKDNALYYQVEWPAAADENGSFRPGVRMTPATDSPDWKEVNASGIQITDENGKPANALHLKMVTNGVTASKSFAFGNVKTGVNVIGAEEGTVRYYDLEGRQVAEPGRGFYIRVSNGKTEKILK